MYNVGHVSLRVDLLIWVTSVPAFLDCGDPLPRPDRSQCNVADIHLTLTDFDRVSSNCARPKQPRLRQHAWTQDLFVASPCILFIVFPPILTAFGSKCSRSKFPLARRLCSVSFPAVSAAATKIRSWITRALSVRTARKNHLRHNDEIARYSGSMEH